MPTTPLAEWYWDTNAHADGSTPPTWPDRSGNGHDLTAYNAPVYINSGLNALPVMRFLHSASQYMQVAGISYGPFTIAFVVKSSNTHVGADEALLYHHYLSDTDADYWEQYASTLMADRSTLGSGGYINAHNGFDDGVWRLIVMRFNPLGDAGTGGCDVFVDGAKRTDWVNYNNQMPDETITATFTLASKHDGTYGLTGDIAYAAIWDTPLTDAEILTRAHSLNTKYAIWDAVTITNYTPTHGQSVDDTIVTITGTNFGVNPGDNTVLFNGAPAAVITQTATEITCYVPWGATTGPITVSTTIDSFTTTTDFYVGIPPAITDIEPPDSWPGVGQTFITGTQFDPTSSNNQVFFSGPGGTWVLAESALEPNGTLLANIPTGIVTGPIKIVTPAATIISDLLFTVLGAPTVTGTSPACTAPGDSLTIYGTDFPSTIGACYVDIGTVRCNVTSATNTQLIVTIPEGAASGLLQVWDWGGNSQPVSVAIAPQILQFEPTHGVPGDTIEIDGYSFDPGSPGANKVWFNGVAATVLSVDPAGQKLTVTAPPTATTGHISVQTSSLCATSTSPLSFTVDGSAPSMTITSFSPAQGPPGTVVNVHGAGFSGIIAGQTVFFANSQQAAITAATTTTLTVIVPALATTGPITVIKGTATASSATNFTVTKGTAPTITRFAGSFGEPTDAVSIHGTGFDASSVVKFNGITATIDYLSADGTLVVAIVPAAATTGRITVTTTAGAGTSAADFVISTPGTGSADAPVITSFTPAAGGAAGVKVTLHGSNFSTDPAGDFVYLNGVPCVLTSVTATTATFLAPAGATTGFITLTTAAGTAVSPTAFTVKAGGGTTTTPTTLPPVINSFTPSTAAPGDLVVVRGQRLAPDASTTAQLAGEPVVIQSLADMLLSFYVPDDAVTGYIEIDTSNGSYVSNTPLKITAAASAAPPVIKDFTPKSGPVGTRIVVIGSGFDPKIPAADNPKINGVGASATAGSDSYLEIEVLPGTTTGPITIETANGTAASSGSFTVTDAPAGTPTAAPTIISFTPARGPLGTLVTITGGNFDPNGPELNGVAFGTVEAAVLSAATDTLTCLTPEGAVTGPITVSTAVGSATSAAEFVVVVGSQGTILPDTYNGAEDDQTLSGPGLLPYLRSMLKDTADDITQLGLQVPTWSDADLLRYLELARAEYSHQRPLRLHQIDQTIANQQFYAAPDLAVAIDDVIWSPAGYDMDQITAIAAALAGGPGILWGGGVPVVGRVYFDSPASIRIWSIIRQAWQETFGGQCLIEETGYNLIPCPTEDGTNVLVFYRAERHWSDIPVEHRLLILGQAILHAVEALTYQVVAASPAQGQKLNLGLRALVQMVQLKYTQSLSLREPGVTAGRS